MRRFFIAVGVFGSVAAAVSFYLLNPTASSTRSPAPNQTASAVRPPGPLPIVAAGAPTFTPTNPSPAGPLVSPAAPLYQAVSRHLIFGPRPLHALRPGNRIILQLSSDLAVPVTITSSQSSDQSPTARALAGRIDGVPLGRVAISLYGASIYASIHGAQLGNFEIRRTRSGDLQVERLTRDGELPCNSDRHAANESDADSVAFSPATIAAVARTTKNATANLVEDVAFFFNDQARVSLGGAAGVPSDADDIRAKIQASIIDANTALADSNIPVTLRAVSIAPIEYPYPAGESMDRALAELRNTGDGSIDQVHSYRDQVGADIVSLWIDNSVEGGLSNLNYPSNIDLKNAFNVIRSKNPTSTFVHEVGHNHGARHLRDSYASTPESFFPDSFAHYFTTGDGGAFVTVVASTGDASRKGATRILRFSAPEISYLGTPTGVEGSANDAETVRVVADFIANFRGAVPTPTPGPTATPAPDITPPTIIITSRWLIRTSHPRTVLRGLARDNAGLARVIYQVAGKKSFGNAIGTRKWKIIFHPRVGRSVVKITALDTAGLKSRPAKITVVRER